MTSGAPVWVVDGDPASVVADLAPDRRVVDGLPDSADWDQVPSHSVWPVTVRDVAECPAVLEAVTRGVAVVVRVVEPMSGPTAARFVDELHRAAGSPVDRPASHALSDEQVRLLEALGRGATLAAAASQIGLAARSASRRLAEARAALGVETTAEAVVLVNRGRS